jgi:hypothetical protein
MIIRVEPKDFFMSTILLIFEREQPDPEDDEVKRYLTDRSLEPRRTFETTYQERGCLVWQFGGCYLGGHLNTIADIQRKYLEEEMLAHEISRVLKESAAVEMQEVVDQWPDARFQELVGTLAKEFHQESSFAPDADGHLTVTLEPAVIQHRFRELLQPHAHHDG